MGEYMGEPTEQDTLQPQYIPVPYDEYQELMRLKAQSLGYGTAQVTTEPLKTLTVRVYDSEWDAHEYTGVAEIKHADNGMILLMGILPDGESVSGIAAFPEGRWAMWEILDLEAGE